MVLGLELMRTERQVIMASMGVDNQAAITATGLSRPTPSHYIWDLFHKRLAMVAGQHKGLFLTVVWTPGHRHRRQRCIDARLPSPTFPALVANLSQKYASLLIQLRPSHIPLAKRLYCIGKAESPICPCCRQHEETVHRYILLITMLVPRCYTKPAEVPHHSKSSSHVRKCCPTCSALLVSLP